MHSLAQQRQEEVKLRPAVPSDVAALTTLEHHVFKSDRLSRRGFRRFLGSRNAAVIAAEVDGKLAGYALVLFREGSAIARLYSIAVAPQMSGRGIGTMLIAAAEESAIERGCRALRLEVHEANAPAIARYGKMGYLQFGRHAHYYQDDGHALRLEKKLLPVLRRLKEAPPYFHQTTEFTCGPACIMMALAWADPSLRPTAALELKLWREATTIFMTAGPGGCEPYGIAVTLKRHRLHPEIFVNQPGPYFIDTVRLADKRRVMGLAQQEFRREAEALNIPIHLAPLSESALMDALDSGAVAIVLVSGYRMLRRNVPHWIFVFGHEAGRVLLHDPAAKRDAEGNALAAETYALPIPEFARMTSFGPSGLRAAILIRKGPNP